MAELDYDTVMEVTTSWDKLKHVADYRVGAGELILSHLFELEPAARALFHISQEDGATVPNQNVSSSKQHAVYKMIDMIDCAVDMLGPDQESLKEDLKRLGVRHYKYGVKATMLPVMEKAVLFMLEEMLGVEAFCRKDMKAWQLMFLFFTRQMQEGMMTYEKEEQQQQQQEQQEKQRPEEELSTTSTSSGSKTTTATHSRNSSLSGDYFRPFVVPTAIEVSDTKIQTSSYIPTPQPYTATLVARSRSNSVSQKTNAVYAQSYVVPATTSSLSPKPTAPPLSPGSPHMTYTDMLSRQVVTPPSPSSSFPEPMKQEVAQIPMTESPQQNSKKTLALKAERLSKEELEVTNVKSAAQVAEEMRAKKIAEAMQSAKEHMEREEEERQTKQQVKNATITASTNVTANHIHSNKIHDNNNMIHANNNKNNNTNNKNNDIKTITVSAEKPLKSKDYNDDGKNEEHKMITQAMTKMTTSSSVNVKKMENRTVAESTVTTASTAAAATAATTTASSSQQDRSSSSSSPTSSPKSNRDDKNNDTANDKNPFSIGSTSSCYETIPKTDIINKNNDQIIDSKNNCTTSGANSVSTKGVFRSYDTHRQIDPKTALKEALSIMRQEPTLPSLSPFAIPPEGSYQEQQAQQQQQQQQPSSMGAMKKITKTETKAETLNDGAFLSNKATMHSSPVTAATAAASTTSISKGLSSLMNKSFTFRS